MDLSKLEKLKVVELKAELQARNLDTKGVKAVLIERLKDAIEKGTPLVEGAASEFAGNEGTAEVLSTPQKRARRRSTRSQTRSPSPTKKPSLEQEPALEPLQEEEPESVVTEESKEEEKIEEEVVAEEPTPDANEDEQKLESENIEEKVTTEENPDEEMKEIENQENGEEDQKIEGVEEQQDEPKAEDDDDKKEARSDRKRSHSRSKSRSRSRSAHSRSRSKSRSRSRSRSPRRRSPAKNADDFTNEEDEPVVEENQIGLSWFDSDLHLLIDPVSFTSAKPMSDPVFDLVWSGARTNYGVKEGKVCFEVRISEETTLSTHFKDEPHVRGLRCGFSTTDSNLLLGESTASFAFCENGKKATNGEFVEFGKPFGLDDVIGCYLDLESSPCTIQYTLNGAELGSAFEFEKSEILGEGEEEKALFPHVLTKGYEFQVNFADNENLLGNVVPPKRQKKIKKTEENAEKQEENQEQKTNGEGESDKKENEDSADGDEEMKDGNTKEKSDDTNEEESKEDEEKKEETESTSPPTQEEEEEEEPQKPREPVFLLPDYQLIGLVDENKLISGPQRSESRKDCEVYLLVGLPGSGKTFWTKNHINENKEKRYNVIGPDTLIAKMSIDGTARKPHHLGKWDKVYEYCISSLSSLEEIATKRRRNFILDQTNAFASAQRRKMKGFGDFKRIAVVCIPSYEELKKRIELKSGEENSVEIRESSVDKLKANFTLPSTEFGWFEEVQFTDLKDDEAKAEVKKYNEKGKRAVDHSSRKRPRNDYRRDDRRRYDDRRRDYRGYRDRDRRGPPNRFGGGGGGGGGYSNNRSGGGGGYRDDRHRNYDRPSGGGGGGGSRYGNNGGGGGGSSWVHGRRGYDDRYRSGGGNSSRYDAYGGGSGGGGSRNDYRERYDRDRDRNGGSRRNDNYRSGGQRDFRAGHRRIEDSRDGGFDRSSSKYNSNDDYDRSSSNSKSTNSSNAANKWGAGNSQQSGVWTGMGQQPQQPQGYWGYDQSAGYNQQAQQWSVNSADPRQQQQWMAYWQQSGNQANPQQQQQYWSQYQAAGYPSNDATGSSK